MSRSHQPGTTPQFQSTTETSRESSTTRFRLPQTLRLRGAAETETETPTPSESSARHIRWSEDVVDNEGMGKKSSKVCCIYHKARAVGESSSEESSSSSSDDSDSESENEIDRRRLRANTRGRRKPAGDQNGSEKCPDDEDSCEHQHQHQQQQEKRKRRKPSPNAYEKIPRSSKPSAHGS